MGSGNLEKFAVRPDSTTLRYRSKSEHRRSFFSLRWLVVILAAYLTLFSHFSSSNLPICLTFLILFAATNVAIPLVSLEWFESDTGRRAIAICDVFFVSCTFYLLRIPETYLYISFVLIFVLAVVWSELKVVLFSLFVVSVLFGAFNYFRIEHFEFNVSMEQFLTLALFFVVCVFYVFLAEQLRRDTRLSLAILEEKRNAEIMVEITRGLSSSLKTDEVLRVVVNRLCEALNATDCSIIGIDPKTGDATEMVRSQGREASDAKIDLASVPELKEARDGRTMVFRDVGPRSVAVVPMIAQDSVLGLIHLAGENTGRPPSERTIRFFEVMASTAANALRNAQLFEEVEHRARTDFLTELPNHRCFQSSLSSELGRAQRHGHTLSLLMIDLDHLKIVNDRFGHPSGDLVIRTVADTIRSSCRDFDVAARYGGEEFTVILPETSLSGAIIVADRIRERISQVEFAGIGRVTASIGVSSYPLNALTKEELIRAADEALYMAKNGGRDRVAYFNTQVIAR